jgi:hypothetical protein
VDQTLSDLRLGGRRDLLSTISSRVPLGIAAAAKDLTAPSADARRRQSLRGTLIRVEHLEDYALNATPAPVSTCFEQQIP